jgi:hypothetical protein
MNQRSQSLVLCVVGLSAFAVSFLIFRGVQSQEGVPPGLQVDPSTIEFLDRIKEYDTVEAKLTLRNQSSTPVLVESVQSHWPQISIQPAFPEPVKLDPHGELQLKLLLSPLGMYGRYNREDGLKLHWKETNGTPRQTLVGTDFEVLGGIQCFPHFVKFESQRQGVPQSTSVRLFDAYPAEGPVISEIRCTPGLTAELVVPQEPLVMRTHEGQRIAVFSEFVHRHDLRITCAPDKPFDIYRGAVFLEIKDAPRATIMIPVYARMTDRG